MWWLFVKYQETEDEIVYHYSMESNDLDGEIVWYKSRSASTLPVPAGWMPTTSGVSAGQDSIFSRSSTKVFRIKGMC